MGRDATPFGAQLRAYREAAGFTQEELATIAGLSVHAVSALERGERRRPHVDTVRALSGALDLTPPKRDAFVASARSTGHDAAVDELSGVSLPVPLTSFLGRDRDVELLLRWLADSDLRLITIVGPGGVGKTRLALEVARRAASQRVLRVAFAPVADVRDRGLLSCAIAEALGLADVSASDLPMRARVACSGRQTLLVLDNLEQITDAAVPVAALLTAAPMLRLLVTSRTPVHIRGEREYALGPLELESADASSLHDGAHAPAIRLFVERVQNVQPNFCLTAANTATVTAICRRLDALPLALELAAPWMKVLTAEDLLQHLENDVLPSAVSPRDLPERQQTMEATVSWSYQLLSQDERRAFRRLGALPGRFSVDAAVCVLAGGEGEASSSDNAVGVLASLVDKSLLRRVPSSAANRPLYRMLETVRAYAARELTAAGELDDALDALVRWCATEASLATEGLMGLAQVAWLDRLHEDLQNYRDAMSWLLERNRPSDASHIAWGLMFFWLIRGHAAEGLWWYEEILKLPSIPPAAEARALVGVALMRFMRGELDRARPALIRAHALAEAAGDTEVLVRSGELHARVELGFGNLREARDWFTRTIERAQALAIPAGDSGPLLGMARLEIESGEFDEAERLLDKAISRLRLAGPWVLTRALAVRANLAIRRGNADQVLMLVAESLTRIRELQDKYAFVHVLVPLAAAAALKGDDAWAARILGARDAVSERTGATAAVKQVEDLRAQTQQEVRARLGPERWAREFSAGSNVSIDALLTEIDQALHASRQRA